MDGFADIDPIVQQTINELLVDPFALAIGYASFVKHASQCCSRADLNKSGEDIADDLGLCGHDDQLAVFHVIAEGQVAAHEDAFLAAGRDLVTDALSGHLTLELGEGQKDIQRQPSHGGRRVERLGDGHEGHTVAVEYLD